MKKFKNSRLSTDFRKLQTLALKLSYLSSNFAPMALGYLLTQLRTTWSRGLRKTNTYSSEKLFIKKDF